MAAKGSSFQILQNRYRQCLLDLCTLSDVLPALLATGIISEDDREAVLQSSDIQSQREKLAKVLAALGSGKLHECLSLIDQFNVEQQVYPRKLEASHKKGSGHSPSRKPLNGVCQQLSRYRVGHPFSLKVQ